MTRVVLGTKNVGGTDRNYYYITAPAIWPMSGPLPLPATTYAGCVDPYLASDNSTGAYFTRIYAVGLLNDAGNNHTAVGVWTLTDPGVPNWNLGPYVDTAQHAAGANVVSTLVDKPTIAVSTHSGTAGYVYVAYMRATQTVQNNVILGTNYSIWVARSTNGGASWDEFKEFPAPAITTYKSNEVNMAQVVVSPTNGYVYVLWVDFNQNRIKLSRSPAPGELVGTWADDNAGPTGNFFSGAATLNGGVRSITVPMARYDSIATRIVVAWHERESAGAPRADVYYSSKGTGGWQTKQRVSDEGTCASTTDQFDPGIDFDGSGNVLISYYSRQIDCADNMLYDVFYTHVNSLGAALPGEGPRRAGTFASDPRLYANRFIGDYQDLWCDTYDSPNQCFGAWIGIPSNSDVYVTQYGVQ